MASDIAELGSEDHQSALQSFEQSILTSPCKLPETVTSLVDDPPLLAYLISGALDNI